MKFSSLTGRIGGDGVDAWQVHYDALARLEAGEDIIVLSVGQETEEVTPKFIVDAAVASLRAGRHHYTPVSGITDLRAAVARHHHRRTGQKVTAANCAIFAGAQNALFALAQCLLEAGDEVIAIAPYYTTYPATFSAAGARLVSVQSRAGDAFQVDPDAVTAAVTSRTRAVVINSPNNPLGVVYERERIEAIARECIARGVWLVCDDVYRELLTDAERAACGHPASVAGADEVCVTVGSLSKSHRMTGWRLGWVVGPVALMRHLENLAVCMSYGLPAFIQDAAVAALRHGDAHSRHPRVLLSGGGGDGDSAHGDGDGDGVATAQQIRRNLDRRRGVAVGMLREAPGVKLIDSTGMFIVFDISNMQPATGKTVTDATPSPSPSPSPSPTSSPSPSPSPTISARQFAQGLLDEQRVAILPCDGFGPGGSHLLRLSLCVDEARLTEACARIIAHAKSLQSITVNRRQNP